MRQSSKKHPKSAETQAFRIFLWDNLRKNILNQQKSKRLGYFYGAIFEKTS